MLPYGIGIVHLWRVMSTAGDGELALRVRLVAERFLAHCYCLAYLYLILFIFRRAAEICFAFFFNIKQTMQALICSLFYCFVFDNKFIKLLYCRVIDLDTELQDAI